MKFSNPDFSKQELTFNDVFIFQNYFDKKSRLYDTNIVPKSPLWTTIPIISANMNQVTWKRMCETLARYWWLWVLPQDMQIEKMLEIIKFVKNAHILYDTPLTLTIKNNVRDALWIINKRAHNSVILVDDDFKPISIFTPSDLEKYEQYELLWNIKKNKLITWKDWIWNEKAFELMQKNNISSLPIIDNFWKLIWILTKDNSVRNSIYKPNIDKNWKLNLAVALWINDFLEKAKKLIENKINIFILDTAHGYQKTMIEAIKNFRKQFWNKPILVAWNVMNSAWTEALLEAWANWIKVGIWPWAMCTTRMMTWVWRPQFSAILDCSKKAEEMWWFIIADWWIRNPRDLALSMVAWASNIMIWTILTWTFESTGDIFYDSEWFMYKKNYWMASKKAVSLRNSKKSEFEIAKKEIFVEWISDSKIYLKKWFRSVWQIVDKFCSWLRSSMTYVWAKDLEEFNKKSIIWVQSSAWYFEWTPHWKIKK